MVTHDSAVMGKTVDGSVTLVLQVCPASVVTRAAWPMSEPLMMLSMSPTIATQNVVPLTHDTGWTAGPSAMPWVTPSDNGTLVQSVPERAARAGVASPIVTAMDAPAASAPSAQLGLFVSFIQFRPHKSGKWRSQRRAQDHQAAGCSP